MLSLAFHGVEDKTEEEFTVCVMCHNCSIRNVKHPVCDLKGDTVKAHKGGMFCLRIGGMNVRSEKRIV